MSKDLGSKIKIWSLIICIAGAVCFIVLAFMSISDIYTTLANIFLAIVMLFMILPLYVVGSLITELTNQREQTQLLSDRLAKLSKLVSGESAVDRFSPTDKIKYQRTGSTVASYSSTGQRRATTQPITKPNDGGTEDYTRSLTDTIDDTKGRTADGVSTELYNAFRTNGSSQSKNAMFMTGSLDTYEINRKENSVKRHLSDVGTISAGGLHSVAVHSDGTCISTGFGTYGQCNVTAWRDVKSISAGNHHTVAVKTNGTCLATGFRDYGQCDVGDWHNICAIATGVGHTVGLMENGMCVATGDNAFGQCNVGDWTNIISIAAGSNYTVGLRADGTIVAVGANTDGQWGAIKWGSISSVAAGGFHTVGLKSDGTCVAVGNNANGQCDVATWSNVQAIAAGNYHTVGLLANGQLIATGYNGYGQCNVNDLDNIIAISAGRNHTMALGANGKVYAVGDNTYGQCNVGDFIRIKK